MVCTTWWVYKLHHKRLIFQIKMNCQNHSNFAFRVQFVCSIKHTGKVLKQQLEVKTLGFIEIISESGEKGFGES